jgi:hypothetical protein
MGTANGHRDGFWRRGGFWLRVGRWGVRVFVGAMALYLAVANVFLTTGLFRRVINFDPDHFRVEYVRAYSIVPGWFHFEGAALRGRDGSVEWILTIDRCDFIFRPFGLALRKFHASHVRAEGLSMRARLRVNAASPEHLAALPPIPGFDYPPFKDAGPEQAPATDANYDLWGVELDDIVADPISEIWIDTIRYSSDLRVRGRWLFRPDRWLDVGPADVDIRRLDASYGKTPLLTGAHGDAVVTLHPSDVRLYTLQNGLGIVDFVSTRLDLEGDLHAADGLQALALSDLAFSRGEGPFAAILNLRKGVLSEGTRVTAEFPNTEAKAEGTTFDALIAVNARVDAAADGKPTLTATIAAERVRAARESAQAEADKVAFALTTRSLALAHSAFDDATFVADVVSARTQSLQPWLSGVPELGVKSGRTDTTVRLEGSFAKTRVSGRVDATLDDVDLAPRGPLRVRMTASASVRAAGEYDGDAGLLTVGESRAALRDLDVAAGRAFVRVPAATIATEGFTRGNEGMRGKVAIDVAEASMSDLSMLGDVAPLPKGISLEQGAPRARANLTVDLASLALDGTAEVDVYGLHAHVGSKALDGNAALRLRATAHRGATDLSGSNFAFDSVAAPTGGAATSTTRESGWWSRMEIAPCTLRLPGGPAFDGQIHFTARDASPITAFIASQTPLPAWVMNAFVPMAGLDVNGRVRGGPSGLAIRSLVARGGGNTVQLEYDSRAKDEEWALLVEAGALGASLHVRDGHTEFVLSDARSWYENKVASLRESSAP